MQPKKEEGSDGVGPGRLGEISSSFDAHGKETLLFRFPIHVGWCTTTIAVSGERVLQYRRYNASRKFKSERQVSIDVTYGALVCCRYWLERDWYNVSNL